VRTLLDRANTFVTSDEEKDKETFYVKSVMTENYSTDSGLLDRANTIVTSDEEKNKEIL